MFQDRKQQDPMHEYLQHQQQQSYHQQQQPLQQFPQNLTYSQKQALKDFDAYELKNLELENKKVECWNLIKFTSQVLWHLKSSSRIISALIMLMSRGK